MENIQPNDNNPNEGNQEDKHLDSIIKKEKRRRKKIQLERKKVMEELLNIQVLHYRYCQRVLSNPDSTMADISKAKRTLRILIQELENLKPMIETSMVVL